MLLDVAGPLLGIGLAVVGFGVVVLVCVAVLRLLSVVLAGSDAEGGNGTATGETKQDPGEGGGSEE